MEFSKGMRVKIIYGMFAGKKGTVLGRSSLKSDAVSILLDDSEVVAVCYEWEVKQL